MNKEFKDLQDLYDTIEDLQRTINSMDLEPSLNETEKVLSVPTDELDVVCVALDVVKKYKELKK